jgi:maltooligosyltrehalose trehalohydrolase
VGNRAVGERLEHLVGMDATKVALGIVLTAPFVPMLFMGEEFAASTPFLYFADHEDEEMRRLVAEGRKRDFAAFGWDQSQIPDPENPDTFERSKLNWSEVHEGRHQCMLQWVKKLIDLRRRTVALNDGDLGHLRVACREEEKLLVMERGPVRILANLGDDSVKVDLHDGESLRLSSREGIVLAAGEIALPKMSFAILERSESQQRSER